MPGKVTDPALLAQLDSAPSGRVTDAALLAKLEGPAVEKTESAARGALQGLTFGWGDEGAAAIAATMPFLEPAAAGAGKSWSERYQQARDYYRNKNRAAKEENPKTFLAGEIGGGLAPLVMTAGGAAAPKTVGLGAKLAQGMKTGATIGATYGAGASEADTPGGMVSDAALGGALGGLMGGAVPVAGAGITLASGPVRRWLERRAVESGRKALSGIGTPLAARKEIPAEVVNQALDTGAIKPFGTVTGAAGRLEAQAESLGAEYGDILQRLEAAGVKGPNAILLAKDLAAEAEKAAQTSLGSARPKMLAEAAEELASKANPTPFADKRLGLMQAEEIKRGLQGEARKEYDKISRQYTTAGETKKELASTMRSAIEDAIQQQADLAPVEAAAFAPVKGRLANTLAALRAAEEGAARAARRKPLSLTSTIAGGAAGAATGNPILALATAAAHGIADRRLASTLATGSRAGARLLGALERSNLSPAQQVEAQRLAAFIAALRSPGASPALAAADEERNP
jgi:hypothetical protein